ncbi:CHAT domain-containing protein [Streptomyces coeruleorubidus]|uniref:CHAT domain-containing protein n=1 Tax=Streptomyces coeruleorubidus TaxID=116188 RepID=A0ABZ0KFR2_STRC4|nr:CHAT domain-containing protein [Streptomyces coeruleorubidus]WOT36621.1 CHAT domain-containing protein [Streptomyces coeruleorubidus]
MATVLELQISELHPREYEVRVVKAAAGGEPRAPLNLNVDELLAQRGELERTVLHSGRQTRRVVPPHEQDVQHVGRQLFDALFSGPVSGTYDASLVVAQERQERLQIVLRLDAPELRLLPWEALFDSRTDSYVCLREPMVRHLAASHTPLPLPVQPPLRILAVIAAPQDLDPLDTTFERKLLEEALEGQITAGLVELVWLTNASWTSLQTRLLNGQWHVLHFIGHGHYDQHYEQGQIALVDERDDSDMIEAIRLADLIGEANPAPRLMVLNSCASGQGGGKEGFSSVGATLADRGVNAVVAMQFSVTDQASLRFTHGFYTALANGRRVDAAVKSGRVSMLGVRQSLEWITPVLYVRGDANVPFTLPLQSSEVPLLYGMAEGELRKGHPGKAITLLEDLLVLDPNNSDAIVLHGKAATQEQLIKLYTRAAQAEEFEDWSGAVSHYEEIIREDPNYRDTVARRDFCRARQRTAHLQEELRSRVNEERWQAAVDVSEELTRLDPAAADPNGLSTHARQQVEKEQRAAYLVGLYHQARGAEHAEDWSVAINCYERILQQDPDNRNTIRRRDFCRERRRITYLQEKLQNDANGGQWHAVLDVSEELSRLDPAAADPDGLATRAHQEVEKEQRAAYLERLYAQGFAAEGSGDWSVAINCYERILQEDPDYRNTVWRCDFCRERRRIIHLQEKLRTYAGEGLWNAVLDVSEKLDQLDPADADPDGLATHAHQEVEKEERAAYLERLYAEARAAELTEDWSDAINLYDILAVEGKGFRDSEQRLSICKERQRMAQPTSEPGHSSPSHTEKILDIAIPCGALAWESNGQYLAVDVWAGAQICVYSRSGGEPLNIRTGKKRAPYLVAFSPDGTRLVGRSGKGVAIWSAHTGEKLLHVPVGRGVAAAEFSPDGTCLATGAYDLACIWDAETVERIFWSEQRFVQAVTFSADGSRLLVADQAGLHVWRVDTAVKLFEDHTRFLNSVAYSPDGKRAAAGCSADTKARLWVSGEVHELDHEASVTSVAFSPNSAQLATGSEDRAARVWDTTNARLICRIFHEDPVLSLAFSPDGTYLATGTRRAVTVWALP